MQEEVEHIRGYPRDKYEALERTKLLVRGFPAFEFKRRL